MTGEGTTHLDDSTEQNTRDVVRDIHQTLSEFAALCPWAFTPGSGAGVLRGMQLCIETEYVWGLDRQRDEELRPLLEACNVEGPEQKIRHRRYQARRKLAVWLIRQLRDGRIHKSWFEMWPVKTAYWIEYRNKEYSQPPLREGHLDHSDVGEYRICRHCHQQFEPVHRAHFFCSNSCRSASHQYWRYVRKDGRRNHSGDFHNRKRKRPPSEFSKELAFGGSRNG